MRALVYLDAGSGSIILQALLGGGAGLAIFVKMFGRKILRAVGLRKPPSGEQEPESDHPVSA